MLLRPSSFSRPTFAGVANGVAPLTEHSVREKRKKEKGEKLSQNSLNALWHPGEHTGPLGHPTTVCKGNKKETFNTWN